MRTKKWMKINIIVLPIDSKRIHVLCTTFQHRALPISLDAIVPNPPSFTRTVTKSSKRSCVIRFDFSASVSRLLFGEKLYSVGLMVVNSSVRKINMTTRSYLVRFTRFCSERERESKVEEPLITRHEMFDKLKSNISSLQLCVKYLIIGCAAALSAYNFISISLSINPVLCAIFLKLCKFSKLCPHLLIFWTPLHSTPPCSWMRIYPNLNEWYVLRH